MLEDNIKSKEFEREISGNFKETNIGYGLDGSEIKCPKCFRYGVIKNNFGNYICVNGRKDHFKIELEDFLFPVQIGFNVKYHLINLNTKISFCGRETDNMIFQGKWINDFRKLEITCIQCERARKRLLKDYREILEILDIKPKNKFGNKDHVSKT